MGTGPAWSAAEEHSGLKKTDTLKKEYLAQGTGTDEESHYPSFFPSKAPQGLYLAYFKGWDTGDKGVYLIWSAEKAAGITVFIIEKSADGKNYIEAGEVKATMPGDTDEYYYTDLSGGTTKKLWYYRLKAFQTDGTVFYSDILPVKKSGSIIKAWIEKQDENTWLVNTDRPAARIELFNTSGEKVSIINPAGLVTKLSPASMPGGTYSLSVFEGNGNVVQLFLRK